MTPHDESLDSLKLTKAMHLLKSKATLVIDTWGFHMIWETESTIQVVTEIRIYNMAVPRKSETH